VSGSSPPRSNLLQRLAANQGLQLGAIVFTILAGIAAIVALSLDVSDRFTEDAPSQRPTVMPSVTVSPRNTPVLPSAAQPSNPTENVKVACFSSGDEPVDCRESHRYELFPGDCTIASLVTYMGGRAGLDVALGQPLGASGGGCLLDSGRDVSTSAREVLAADDGDDAWRRCYDNRRGQIVPCDAPHSGEYIATGATSKATQDECIEAARAYMDRSIAANAELLRVQVIDKIDPNQNSPRCLISIRGNQRLGASLRHLGVNTVPIAS
jgi:hypothetical protein